MKYYSTNHNSEKASLKEAIIRGLAPDRGLYMPERIPAIPPAFFRHIGEMTLQDIAYVVANTLFGEDMESEALKNLIKDALNFDIPLVKVDEGKYSLELFHGPTLAFKDVGARFMARMLAYFSDGSSDGKTVHVLVATSGDTGSAVANGFLNVPGVHVHVLYPKGKVSPIQEAQFTTLGNNITAIEVDGTFDDCQAMVKSAFSDPDVTKRLFLTSANSINVARFLPQMFYYYHAYARLMSEGVDMNNVVVAVPSGNFGNICSALIAKRMGLPIKRFIAANNRNDVFLQYLQTGKYSPRPSIPTIANAMDVGDPSNFARILDLYDGSHDRICADICGCSFDDDVICRTIKDEYQRSGYLLDPHGAVAYHALCEQLRPGETGIFLATAHPAKFKDTVESVIGKSVSVPKRLSAFLTGEKRTVKILPLYPAFKKYLLALD
ncbi:MAG: threonine synthase [Muribaculum sp.]|nr:threonine synthase [Muribaculum sp.]